MDVGWFTMNDVDAGPVIGGYGMAASAFGVGAVRAMGDADRARALAAEGLIAAWPLPNGTLLMPRLLSNFSEAPYLGEAATLFALTRRPILPVQRAGRTGLPGSVYLGVLTLLCLGLGEIVVSLWCLRRWYRNRARRYVPLPRLQVSLWLALLVTATAAWLASSPRLALMLLLAAQILPHRRKRRPPAAEEEAAAGDITALC